MDWHDIRWQIPLENRPTALLMGVARHGSAPIQRYVLGDVWCLHLYRYHGWMRVRGEQFPIRPGHASITPPNVELEHQFDDPVCIHITIHFTLPAISQTPHHIPAMQDTGKDNTWLTTALEEAVGTFPLSALRAEVRLWDVLWHLTGRVQPADPNAYLHPAVRQTLQSIEMRLGEPISVARLAAEANLSHSHLSRLFRAEVGSTIIGYLQRRRMERARHLLAYSNLPPKSIAMQVGIPDLHLFNKTLRRDGGLSPRALRNDSQSQMQ